LVSPDFKTEIFPTVSFTNRGKRSASLPASIDTSSLREVHFPISQNSYDHPILLDTTSVDSPLYSPCESEETSPLFPSSPSSSFLYLDNQFPETLPHNFQATTSKSPMDAARGGVAGGGAGGGGAGGQVPPPRIFAKVAARYAPLVLPVPLHDLPENYMKNLLKFTGEGDLTAVEHINFFDQFVNILGLEHEDVYSRLLVQTFEGQVRTWF
jgi:hypothetical protein